MIASPVSSAPIALRTTERAVAADQEPAVDPPHRAGIEIAQANVCRSILNHHVLGRAPVDDADARLGRGMLEQDRLEKDLIDPVRRLRRRPVAVGAIFGGEAVAAAGNRNPRQFLTRKGGAIADVVRIIRRQPGVAHLLGQAQPPEDFHGAGGHVIAFRLRRRGAGARLHNRNVDAAPGEIDRKREPDRSRANDQHIGVSHSGSIPELRTTAAQRSTSLLM